MNRMEGTIEAVEGKAGILSIQVSTPAGPIEALVFGTSGSVPWIVPSARVVASFKESDVLVAPRGAFPWPGSIPARVAGKTDSDILSRLDLDCGGGRIVALVPVVRLSHLGIGTGSEIDAWVHPHEVVLEEIGT
jgi:hypothetical protein